MTRRLPRLRIAVAAVVLALTASLLVVPYAAASGEPTTAEPLPDYDALFHHETGWTGADANVSVDLGNDRTLWLWGDTFYGDIVDGRRCVCITRNSISLQRGTDPATATVDYFYGPEHDGVPTSFFVPPGGDGWFWPRHGVRTRDGVYVFLTQLVKDDSDPQFIYGKRVASWVARIPNPDDPPAAWRTTYTKLPWSRHSDSGVDRLSIGQAVVRAGLLYVYATEEVQPPGGRVTRHLLTARVPEAHIDDFDQWQFYDDGDWSSDQLDASRGFEVISPDFSVSYQPSLRSYVVVYSDWTPANLGANGRPRQIAVRQAPGPTGPWSGPQVVYQCPEPGQDPARYCYAAKGHPQLSTAADELIVSYATSNARVGAVGDTSVYFPRFVRVRFPEVHP